MKASTNPLAGAYTANALNRLYYGSDVVRKLIKSTLPTKESKAFIVTGQSLATKTPVIRDLEELLQPENHAGTFSNIGQHANIAELNELTNLVERDDTINAVISVGGGSPIDSAKVVIYRVHEASGRWLTHISIPTTLSAAECTIIAGYTDSEGVKTRISHPNLCPAFVFYDPKFGLWTPRRLFLSTGIRALDHAVEIQYHPYATQLPARSSALNAVGELFRLLPQYKADPKDENVITGLFLAAYASLGFFGQTVGNSLMLSHSIGYALGSPYAIPHGITSCLTLAPAVKLMARWDSSNAQNIAKILPYMGEEQSGNDLHDSNRVGDRIIGLVGDLGLITTLTDYGVNKDQLDVIAARSLRLDPAKDDKSQECGLLEHVKQLVSDLW